MHAHYEDPFQEHARRAKEHGLTSEELLNLLLVQEDESHESLLPVDQLNQRLGDLESGEVVDGRSVMERLKTKYQIQS